jgi:hypothetical protein
MADFILTNRPASRWPTLVVIGATLAVVALLALGVRSSVVAATSADHPRTCFPVSKWDANPGLRPCARVVRVFEDGSLRVQVSDANGNVRFSAGVGAEDR